MSESRDRARDSANSTLPTTTTTTDAARMEADHATNPQLQGDTDSSAKDAVQNSRLASAAAVSDPSQPVTGSTTTAEIPLPLHHESSTPLSLDQSSKSVIHSPEVPLQSAVATPSTALNRNKLDLPKPSIWPGTYLRLEPLNLDALPKHESFSKAEKQSNLGAGSQSTKSASGAPQANRPAIRDFVLNVLAEAIAVGRDHISDWRQSTTKKYFAVDSPIEIFETRALPDNIKKLNIEISPNQVRDWYHYPPTTEYWFARESFHADRTEPGTASWSEFVAGLRDNHTENERSYTPDIYDARLILDYARELKEAGLTDQIDGLSMRIFEIAHSIKVANNRVFASLVLTASISPSAFIVAQLPINLRGHAAGFYSNGLHKRSPHPSSPSLPHPDPKSSQSVTIGSYVSVEYCERQPLRLQSANSSATAMQTRWVMATASDAKGLIPHFLQEMAIPGTIAKDVKFFVEWCRERRAAGDAKGQKQGQDQRRANV